MQVEVMSTSECANIVDPKNGRQIRRSIYGKAHKEVREWFRQSTTDVDAGAYVASYAMRFSA